MTITDGIHSYRLTHCCSSSTSCSTATKTNKCYQHCGATLNAMYNIIIYSYVNELHIAVCTMCLMSACYRFKGVEVYESDCKLAQFMVSNKCRKSELIAWWQLMRKTN